MKIYNLNKDKQLFCVKAESFPEGINGAQQKFASLPVSHKDRNHFGISYLYDNAIVYFAAGELKGDETIPAGCEKYTVKSGKYISIEISDFRKDISRIGDAFEKLTSDPRIDEKGCCVEWYLPEGSDHRSATDVLCMVRLADEHA